MAAAAPNARLLHSLVLKALPRFPDVLIQLLLSYHTNAMLLVDSSGSMYGTESKFQASWKRLEQYFGDAAAFSCIGFHHARIPGYLQMSDFLKSSGLTDLSIPLDQATEAVKAGCSTLILFTDGANNAASEAQMFESMHRFYEAVMKLDKCWLIKFHFITVNDWWCKSTMSALSSLFGVANQRVEVTVTDVDTFLKEGFNTRLKRTNLEQFQSILDLRASLPPENRQEINKMLSKFIQDEERRERKKMTKNTEQKDRVFTSLRDLATFFVDGDPPPPLTGVGAQMRALLNGVTPSTPPKAVAISDDKPKRDPKVVEFLNGLRALASPVVAAPLPPTFDSKTTVTLLDAGDTTNLVAMLVEVVGISDGAAKQYSLSDGIQQNALKRFQAVLVVPKRGVPYSAFTQRVLDQFQTRLIGVSASMAQKTRISFLVTALQLGLTPQINAAIAVVAECWMVEKKPYSPEQVPLFASQMLSDLKHVAQGERQSFSQGGELAANLAMLWCILGHKDASIACGIGAFGGPRHIQLWLGVTGMWARFATDTKCWDLYTMLETKVDLTAYAALIVGLKSKYQQELHAPDATQYFNRARAMLDKYVDAAQRAVAWHAETVTEAEREESMRNYSDRLNERIQKFFADRAAAAPAAAAPTQEPVSEATPVPVTQAPVAVVAEAPVAAISPPAPVAASPPAPVVASPPAPVVASTPPVAVSVTLHVDPQSEQYVEEFPELGAQAPAPASRAKPKFKPARKTNKVLLAVAPRARAASPEAQEQAKPVSVHVEHAVPEMEAPSATVVVPVAKPAPKKATIEDLKFTPPAELVGTQQLCPEEAAAVFTLTGILDIKALSDHAIALIRLLNRKPKDNTGDQLEIFRALSKCLKFGPQRSVRGALQFIRNQHPATCKSLEEVTMTAKVIDEFLTYVTTFEPLFELPPPTGWATPEWLELNRLTGINLETVPLNAATEPHAHVFKLAKEYQEGMRRLHTRDYKFLTLPRMPDGSFSRQACGCGAELLPFNEPGKVRVLPSPPPVKQPPPDCMDPIGWARRQPKPVLKSSVVVACLPDGPSPMHHLGEWTRFLLQEYKNAHAPLMAIEQRLATLKGPDDPAKLSAVWGKKGCSADWLNLNHERVKQGEQTKVFVLEKLLWKVLPSYQAEVELPPKEEVLWRREYWNEVLKRESAIKKEFGMS